MRKYSAEMREGETRNESPRSTLFSLRPLFLPLTVRETFAHPFEIRCSCPVRNPVLLLEDHTHVI
jgi:hypothetical protein